MADASDLTLFHSKDLESRVKTLETSFIVTETKGLSSIPTFPANSNTQVIYEIGKSGYTPIGICGFSGSYSSGLIAQEYIISAATNRAFVYYQNVTTSNRVPSKLQITVLYRKNI